MDVHTHAVPYITFMAETLPNNSYVDVSLVRTDSLVSLVRDPNKGGEGVQCHTDTLVADNRAMTVGTDML